MSNVNCGPRGPLSQNLCWDGWREQQLIRTHSLPSHLSTAFKEKLFTWKLRLGFQGLRHLCNCPSGCQANLRAQLLRWRDLWMDRQSCTMRCVPPSAEFDAAVPYCVVAQHKPKQSHAALKVGARQATDSVPAGV